MHFDVFLIAQAYPAPATSGAISAYDQTKAKSWREKICLTRWVVVSQQPARVL